MQVWADFGGVNKQFVELHDPCEFQNEGEHGPVPDQYEAILFNVDHSQTHLAYDEDAIHIAVLL
jgi:hypothetical protein